MDRKTVKGQIVRRLTWKGKNKGNGGWPDCFKARRGNSRLSAPKQHGNCWCFNCSCVKGLCCTFCIQYAVLVFVPNNLVKLQLSTRAKVGFVFVFLTLIKINCYKALTATQSVNMLGSNMLALLWFSTMTLHFSFFMSCSVLWGDVQNVTGLARSRLWILTVWSFALTS